MINFILCELYLKEKQKPQKKFKQRGESEKEENRVQLSSIANSAIYTPQSPIHSLLHPTTFLEQVT